MPDSLEESASASEAAPAPSRSGSGWLFPVLAGSAVTVLAAYLIFGPKPWADGLDTSREVKESIRTHSYGVIGFWYGSLMNLILFAIAIAAWFSRPRVLQETPDESSPISPLASRSADRSIMIVATAGAMILVAWMMWPRLGLSLWGDEEATARRYVTGQVYRLPDDPEVFYVKQPKWEKALWNWDSGPNNHMLFNVLARLSHGPAKTSGEDPGQFYFSETRIRLPSFAATLIMIGAIGWLLSLLGFPRAAPLALFFLALHPWVIRFGSDARGYGLMMAFGPLAIAFLIKALRSKTGGVWWIAFGLCEFLMLYSHLVSIYLLIPLNLAALWFAWRPLSPEHRNPFRVAQVWRWAEASLIGAALSIQMMLPNAMQLRHWLDTGRLDGEINLAWLQNWGSDWMSGMPWHSWDPENPFAFTLQQRFSDHPVLVSLLAFVVCLLTLVGFCVLIRRPVLRVWLIPLALPLPLLVLQSEIAGTLLYPWYSVGFLSFAAVIAGIGFCRLLETLRKRLEGTSVLAAEIVLTVSIVALFAFVSQPQRQAYRTRSVEPLAESIRSVRDIVNPFHPGIDEVMTLGFIHATRLYDPAMKPKLPVRNDEEFLAVIREAEEKNRPLSVNAANLDLGRPVFPLAFKLLENREVFSEPEIFWGLQDPCTRFVFRYLPGGLERAGIAASETEK